MKKLLFIAVIGAFTALQVNAQEDKVKLDKQDVPQAVKSGFESQFANASDVKWKAKKGKYKAKFEMNGKKHMAEFNNNGQVESQGEQIEKNQLPTLVADEVNTDYSADKVDEAYRVEKEGQTYYLVTFDGSPDKMVMFDAQGKVVKEKTKKK